MNYLGLIGLLGLTGEPGGRPIQSAGQIADLGGGALMAAFGVMAALRERERSGEGQLVDVSMTDGALAWLAMVAGRIPLRRRRSRSAATAQLDRRLRLLPALRGGRRLGHLRRAGAEVLARLLRRASGAPDLIEKQFEPPGSDAWREVADVFSSRTRDEWRAFNDEHDAMIEPVLDLDEALDSELVREREMVVELEQPELGPVRLLGVPVKLSRTPGDADAARRRRSASTPRRCCARPASPTTRSRRCSRAGAVGRPERRRAEPGRFMG